MNTAAHIDEWTSIHQEGDSKPLGVRSLREQDQKCISPLEAAKSIYWLLNRMDYTPDLATAKALPMLTAAENKTFFQGDV